MPANVFINGTKVGSHKGGFTPFEFEISKYINSGENCVRVDVSNILDKQVYLLKPLWRRWKKNSWWKLWLL